MRKFIKIILLIIVGISSCSWFTAATSNDDDNHLDVNKNIAGEGRSSRLLGLLGGYIRGIKTAHLQPWQQKMWLASFHVEFKQTNPYYYNNVITSQITPLPLLPPIPNFYYPPYEQNVLSSFGMNNYGNPSNWINNNYQKEEADEPPKPTLPPIELDDAGSDITTLANDYYKKPERVLRETNLKDNLFFQKNSLADESLGEETTSASASAIESSTAVATDVPSATEMEPEPTSQPLADTVSTIALNTTENDEIMIVAINVSVSNSGNNNYTENVAATATTAASWYPVNEPRYYGPSNLPNVDKIEFTTSASEKLPNYRNNFRPSRLDNSEYFIPIWFN